ncbi:adenylosuccinate lyase family protein [Rhizobium sp. LC145]|uniref:class-II fumarase/aspartase family protein n=1 Tax=Rhizobium sp. LC145 TaxID=1120688 RepID=UPI000699518A|nr:adenylosuccinate lyase family protein [Rhizobium sp. LC145]TKT57756.1 adenylosuccinate lyase family protein [Rhizobiaceae bacterium LC148]
MGTEFNDALTSQYDYRGLRDAFAPPAMYQAFLDVEKAVALAQGELGMIPAASAEAIAGHCRFEYLDTDRLDTSYRTTRHPLMPLINELVRLAGPQHGGYVHWGITTQNVIQTGLLLLAKRAQATLDGLLADILRHLGRHARTHAKTIMAGRTHYRHAVPITFGFKVAVWIDEFLQAADRLREAESRAFVVMTGGAVGCFSALGREGPALQSRVAALLRMGEMAIPSRAIRTHMCEYVNALSLTASICHKIAEEIYQSSSEEYGELHEGRVEGSIGSSTMPQKINPILCYGIIANSNKLYSCAGMLMASAHRPFESDGSANQMFEDGLAEVIGAISEILVRTELLVRDLYVDKERMRSNLDLSHGAILGEFAMMRLGETLGKHKGHELVHDAAMAAAAGRAPFLDELAQLPGGQALRTEIEDRLETGSTGGICAEYALHFGSLVENIGAGSMPTAEQRNINAYLKADR